MKNPRKTPVLRQQLMLALAAVLVSAAFDSERERVFHENEFPRTPTNETGHTLYGIYFPCTGTDSDTVTKGEPPGLPLCLCGFRYHIVSYD